MNYKCFDMKSAGVRAGGGADWVAFDLSTPHFLLVCRGDLVSPIRQ